MILRTFYRYVLGDLLRLSLAALGVLVIVVSVGFSIKPISQGLLEPIQLVRVLFYTMPAVITFALPFAMAFAGTMLFLRMNQDREITLCATCGISYPAMFWPLLMWGLTLTITIFVLSNWVTPLFWAKVGREIEMDMAKMVVRQIHRGENVRLGRMVLYADQAIDRYDDPNRTFVGAVRPYNTILLRGVAVGEVRRSGESKAASDGKLTKFGADMTAEKAWIDLYRDVKQDRLYAKVTLADVTINDPRGHRWIGIKRQQLGVHELPSLFEVTPKFMSLDRLQEVAENPVHNRHVREKKQQLCQTLGRYYFEQMIKASLDQGAVELQGLSGESYRITAPQMTMDDGQMVLQGQSQQLVHVETLSRGIVTQRIEAQRAEVQIGSDRFSLEPRMALTLLTCRVLDQLVATDEQLAQPTRKRIVLAGLTSMKPFVAPLFEQSVTEVITMAGQVEQRPLIQEGLVALQENVLGLRREIVSRLHERMAMSAHGMLIFLLSVVLALRRRECMLLTTFLWVFIPAVIVFLAIHSGQNLISQLSVHTGLAIGVTWLGNGGLLIWLLWLYRGLRRT